MNLGVFNQPYPLDLNWKREITSAFLYGLFIFSFLYFFEPFGLSFYQDEHKTYHLLGYGLVTTSMLLITNSFSRLLLPNWYTEKSWTVGKNILYTTLILFLIGTANLLYSVWLRFLNLNLEGFLFYQGVTLAVGFFPVTIGTLINYSKYLKRSVKAAKQLNSQLKSTENAEDLLNIPSRNKSEKLEIAVKELLMIKSVENYVEVYRLQNDSYQKEVIRNTLSRIEEHLNPYPTLKRCHRSYLVNLDQISSFSGNAQGLSLHLKTTDNLIVPVSRSYVKEMKSALSEAS